MRSIPELILAGNGYTLQACCQVRRLANNRLLLSGPRPDQIADDDQSRRNAYAGLQWRSRLQRADSLDHLQPSPHRPLGAETVRRFDGFVAKYMGDGVLVYFGYPQAHEDP
jgi:hypothetical protein